MTMELLCQSFFAIAAMGTSAASLSLLLRLYQQFWDRISRLLQYGLASVTLRSIVFPAGNWIIGCCQTTNGSYHETSCSWFRNVNFHLVRSLLRDACAKAHPSLLVESLFGFCSFFARVFGLLARGSLGSVAGCALFCFCFFDD